MPLRAWTPPQDADLNLEHRRGERLDEAWIRRQFEKNGMIGAPIGVDRLLALVQLINRGYLSAGFVNSGLAVSPQDRLDDQLLDLVLIAGRLTGPATVQWAPGGPKGLGEAYVRNRMPAASNQPLSAIAIERDFRLLAEDPAIRTVNADLRPGARPGEASLLLTVTPQDRFDIYLSAANSRSPSVGGERFAAGGLVRNLLTGGDLLSGEYGETEGLSDATLSYSTPFLTPRTLLSLRGSLNNAAVIDRPLLPLDIESRDRSAEIGLTQRLYETPLLPAATPGKWNPARALSAGLLLTYRESKTFLFGEPFSFSPGSVNGRAEYYALRLTADYVQRNVSEVIALSLTGTLGLDGTRSDVEGVASPSRNFGVLLAQLNYARRLTDSGLEFRGRLTGQYTNGTLYSGERLSAGGEETVRGYRENLLLADRGVIGSAELSHPLRLGAEPGAGSRFDWGNFSLTGFFDAAYLDNADAADPSPRFIPSTGVALAWNPSEAIQARVSFGAALRDIRQTGTRDLQDRGVHFRLTFFPLRLLRR